jgi:hypothetical protein
MDELAQVLHGSSVVIWNLRLFFLNTCIVFDELTFYSYIHILL